MRVSGVSYIEFFNQVINLTPGDNAITFEFKDNYGNSRKITKNIFFDVLPPETYGAVPGYTVGSSSYLDIRFLDYPNSNHYNAIKKLTFTINGKAEPLTFLSTSILVDLSVTKTYEVVITNKYGLSSNYTATFP